MVFEIGKYYEHTGGGKLHILSTATTTMWGNTLIAESDEGDLSPVGKDEVSAQNWYEITGKKWMDSFNKEDGLCAHEWIVTVGEDNYPEDVMCDKCKEVIIMVVTA